MGGGEADEEVVLVEQEKAVKGEIAGGEGEGGEEGFERGKEADEGGGGGAQGEGDGEGDPEGRMARVAGHDGIEDFAVDDDAGAFLMNAGDDLVGAGPGGGEAEKARRRRRWMQACWSSANSLASSSRWNGYAEGDR